MESTDITYSSLTRGDAASTGYKYQRLQLELLRCRIKLLFRCRGEPPPAIPSKEKALIEFLYDMRRNEDHAGQPFASFTSVFYCLRGKQAHVACQFMLREVSSFRLITDSSDACFRNCLHSTRMEGTWCGD